MATKKKASKKKASKRKSPVKNAHRKSSPKKKASKRSMPPRRARIGATSALDADAPIGRCLYMSSGNQTCADVTEAWCRKAGGQWDPNARCPT
jgi:hypothetical protein